MSIWRFLKHWWRGPQKKKKYFFLSPSLQLIHPAAQEKRKQKKRTSSSTVSLHYDRRQDERERLWDVLSSRERDVTALTCLGYTNAQIAARLGLSIETIKTYLEHVSNKSDLRNKADLRVFFASWDFSAWERRSDPYR
jgi:DNA-binding CsgD family transcriptional regulator